MRMKIGHSSDDVVFTDDDGNELKLVCAKVDITLRPQTATAVHMVVYVDEIEVDVPNNQILTTKRTRR